MDGTDRAAHAREPVNVLSISKRLQKDSRWLTVIEPLRTRMMRECRQKGMSKADAQAWTYSELDRLYPPEVTDSAEPAVADHADQGVSGLGALPDSWPKLPPNASLAAEIQWVQASRLDVLERTDSGGTRVNLARADRPAPSKGALSWLETSILFPSKFADVLVKARANQDDEREGIRREKLAIEEIRALLSEMLEDGDVP